MTIFLNLMYLSSYANLYSFIFPLNISENHDSAGSKEKLRYILYKLIYLTNTVCNLFRVLDSSGYVKVARKGL